MTYEQARGSGDSERPQDEAWAFDTLREMARLDELQRATIERVYFEHQSQREIARDLALPEPMVAVSLASGLQALAGLLDTFNSSGLAAR